VPPARVMYSFRYQQTKRERERERNWPRDDSGLWLKDAMDVMLVVACRSTFIGVIQPRIERPTAERRNGNTQRLSCESR